MGKHTKNTCHTKNKRGKIIPITLCATTIAITGVTLTTVSANTETTGGETSSVVATRDIEPTTRIVEDTTLPKGIEKLVNNGNKGRADTIRTIHTVNNAGNKTNTIEEKTIVAIPPTEKVVRVGTNENSVVEGVDPHIMEETRRERARQQQRKLELLQQKQQQRSTTTTHKIGNTGTDTSTPLYDVPDTATGVTTPSENRAFLRSITNDTEFQCADEIVRRESGYQTQATNPSSGAYGIPQSLPGNKMASMGADWRTNGKTQIKWMKTYVDGRYGGWCGALQAHNSKGWY